MTRKDEIPEDDYGIEQWATDPDPKPPFVGRVRGDFAEIMQISLSDSESQLLLYKQAYKALLKSRAYWRSNFLIMGLLFLAWLVGQALTLGWQLYAR